MRSPISIGMDIGSVAAKAVVLDPGGNIILERYERTRGEPLETALRLLAEVIEGYGAGDIRIVSATGSGGKLVAGLVGAYFCNEVIAQARAAARFHPETRTIIEMGGQDAKLILMGQGGRIEDFQMNSVCAAGTGSFLDQQAIRMGLTIEEFGRLALKSENPPRIAGRCSVFAKSDMIHLQQIATPDYDMVAGLCHAVARNFKATIGKGREFARPVSFHGGVAANLGVRKAFKEVLGLADQEYIVPERFASMGAIGAVLVALDKGKGIGSFKGLSDLERHLRAGRKREGSLDRLARPEGHPSERRSSVGYAFPEGKSVEVYLGIDVGSTSTNVVLIDMESRLVAKRYLATAGRPIEAVRQGLKEIALECAGFVEVIGVGTTGSGRHLTGDFVGADVVRNEITAQATAASAIDPLVDTVFEIGGQDSKYIAISDGVVVDFEMNKVCAAGTGSFLEEQAERLGISIKKEFGDMALKASAPAKMGERCTVFIESDMVHHQQKGVGRDDLVAGLAYSIAHNYLNRVVGDRRIGRRILLQGGTAANLAVVSAFERITGRDIRVPEHHDVTGAIGAAILAMREKDPSQKTNFKGFDLGARPYELRSFVCRDCANVCEIREVAVKGERPLYYGGRCEKYDMKAAGSKGSHLADLFREREKILFSSCAGKNLAHDAPRVGLPRMLFNYEMYPFWKAFFTELGYRVVLSSPTNREIIKHGVERTVSETCFPIKVAHGHIEELASKGVERIFMPSIINMRPSGPGQAYTVVCPYVQALPYMSRAAFDFDKGGASLISPVIRFNQPLRDLRKEFYALCKPLSVERGRVRRALDAAFEADGAFRERLLQRGREFLSGLKDDALALVIIGRTYNTMDPGLNLELPQKLRDMGIPAVPFDMLPIEEEIDDSLARDMYWKSGQRILAAAKYISKDPRLFAVYITNFGCGPDSFISHFFKDMSKGKPFLQLEIDEHSADAGAITRCEAFIDSLRNVRSRLKPATAAKTPVQRTAVRKKLYIPNMADGSFAVAAAFQASGIDAEVMPESDEETLRLGRSYTSGRECYPSVLTTGDMIKVTRRQDFDPGASAFFMPSGNGPCRFGQYNRYHRLVLDEMGFKDVPVYAPDQDEAFYKELGIVGGDFLKLAWWGIVAVDLLEKRARETRPYEINKGETGRVYGECLRLACDAIRQGRFPEREMAFAKEAFGRVTVSGVGEKPVVAIVGEIYVRNNRFSNENIVQKLEALGAEARMPPVAEWVSYANYCAKQKNWGSGSMGNYLRTLVQDYYQRSYGHELENIFNGDMRGGHELGTEEILRLAAPYVHESFEGEAVLSVGKAVDYLARGAHGIINAMPFTCMPGTVVNAVLKRVREDSGNAPYLNMVYEGVEDTNAQTRLEAFVHQAREFMERRRA